MVRYIIKETIHHGLYGRIWAMLFIQVGYEQVRLGMVQINGGGLEIS